MSLVTQTRNLTEFGVEALLNFQISSKHRNNTFQKIEAVLSETYPKIPLNLGTVSRKVQSQH